MFKSSEIRMRKGKCMLCGERRILEEHHINRWLDPYLTILICRNCHLNIQALVERFRPPDALSYCELGGKFTNLCMNIPIRVIVLRPRNAAICIEYEFCAVDECRYKPKNRQIISDAIITLIENWLKPKGYIILEGRLRIADDEGRFWLQREDVIKWLLSLINDKEKRRRLSNWYRKINRNLAKIRVDEYRHRIIIGDITLEPFL